MNGIIGSVESLLGLMIEILGNNHKDELNHLQYLTETINRMLGFMVVVPSNPEDQYFILVDGMLSLVDDATWTADVGCKMRCEIYINVVRFLASQVQEKLPYRIKNVNSNDQIFIGSEDFEQEANKMMDFCFSQILEKITQMNEQKD